MRDNALKRPFQIITSVCDTCVTAGSYGLKFIGEFYCICTTLFMLHTAKDINLQDVSCFPKRVFVTVFGIDLTSVL